MFSRDLSLKVYKLRKRLKIHFSVRLFNILGKCFVLKASCEPVHNNLTINDLITRWE